MTVDGGSGKTAHWRISSGDRLIDGSSDHPFDHHPHTPITPTVGGSTKSCSGAREGSDGEPRVGVSGTRHSGFSCVPQNRLRDYIRPPDSGPW